MDGATKVDMILETLQDPLKHFKFNYSMNKMLMNLLEFMRTPKGWGDS